MSHGKELVAAALLLWLLGLVAAVLARRHRSDLAMPHPNQPLLAYVVITAAALVAGGLYWRLSSKRQPLADTSSEAL